MHFCSVLKVNMKITVTALSQQSENQQECVCRESIIRKYKRLSLNKQEKGKLAYINDTMPLSPN